jgi:hypothetical protein
VHTHPAFQRTAGAFLSRPKGGGRQRNAPAPLTDSAAHMHLKPGDIVPEALHRKVGWDMRHHFMAEKIIDRFWLVLPRDRELVRQLSVLFVLDGLTKPPEAEADEQKAA